MQLADMYISIHEPAKAKDILVGALKLAKDKDASKIPELQLKLGNVLISMHEYRVTTEGVLRVSRCGSWLSTSSSARARRSRTRFR